MIHAQTEEQRRLISLVVGEQLVEKIAAPHCRVVNHEADLDPILVLDRLDRRVEDARHHVIVLVDGERRTQSMKPLVIQQPHLVERQQPASMQLAIENIAGRRRHREIDQGEVEGALHVLQHSTKHIGSFEGLIERRQQHSDRSCPMLDAQRNQFLQLSKRTIVELDRSVNVIDNGLGIGRRQFGFVVEDRAENFLVEG